MGHPDSGQIQAFLDREIDGQETDTLRAHLADCPECRVAVQTQEAVVEKASRALLLLDSEPHPGNAQERILARLNRVGDQAGDQVGDQKPSRDTRETLAPPAPEEAEKAPRTRPGWLSSFSLPKAASIALLLTGLAATALPGSPVRSWMVDGWRSVFGPTTGATTGAEEGITEPIPGDEPSPFPEREELVAGASVTAGEEAVELWVYDLPAEANLQVVWVEGGQAWIRAGEGTRFTRGANRLEAHSPPGPVRVEIPRDLQVVLVGVDGNILLRKSGDELEILGPVSTRGPSEVVFGPVRQPNEGRP